MLTLLAVLLLSGPVPARADDAAPIFDAADTNRDGKVSGKERRQKRRADRRARRGSKADMSDEELDAADAAESSARGGAAASKASSAAAALKSSLPSGDAGDIPGESGSRASGRETSVPSAHAAGAAKPTGDPGKPSAPSDFALSARSGYAPAFAAAGLKLGPDGKSVLRLDGKPATQEDYARLKREIAAMPAALGRRPDFFSVVSPAHYADLKQGFAARRDADEVYKHVATTEEDRDFVHSASCDKLSGECNKSSEKASYRKGDYVAPEDLDNMWAALQNELDGSAEADGMPDPSAERSRAARDTAVGAAIALTGGGSDGTAPAGAASKAATGSTPASVAAASARTFLKKAFKAFVPNAAGEKGADTGPSLALGALALAALTGGAMFLRRKG